ncbi:opioid growth factor receptor [Silurus meridionalis]|nr:opioid growth factor receptor [Silurus meridionalis]
MDKPVTPGRRMGNFLANNEYQSEQYDSTWDDGYEDTSEEIWEHVTDDEDEDDNDLPNIKFYRNQIHFVPDGVNIEEFHKTWSKDYDRLEYVHSYIQWLFPIPEKGMNYLSSELSPKEAKLFCTDEEVRRRLLVSYKIMLDFYGIQLVNEETGEVQRAENWSERFDNLNRNTHNNLRITRILKCLGLLKFRHYQAPLVRFFLEETLVKKTLPRVRQSVLDYFMFTVLDRKERQELIKYAFLRFNQREKFVWCPRRICSKFLNEERASIHNIYTDPNENDSTSRRDHSDLMNSSVQFIDEIKTDTNEDAHAGKLSISKDKNDENVSGECHDSEKQALPDHAEGNAHTIDINEVSEAPTGADSQDDHHLNLEAADQEDAIKAAKNSVPKATEENEDDSKFADSTKQPVVASDQNTDETPNHENVARKTPPSHGNSASEQDALEHEGDELKEGNGNEHGDLDSKKHDSVEIQKSVNEPADRIVSGANGTATNDEANPACNKKSADTKSQKCISREDIESNASFEQTSVSRTTDKVDTESERVAFNLTRVTPGKDEETGERSEGKPAGEDDTDSDTDVKGEEAEI